MRAVDIIRKKRDGGVLSREEIGFLVGGYVREEIPDYQISSFCMAVFFRGMNGEETAWLTEEMMNSGKVITLDGLKGPFVDKHSTGGVGDKISLILAPLAASLGVTVPMMSGRGLGHTGGTLDKLEAIPGYSVNQSEAAYRSLLENQGMAMIGQSENVVPADKRLYALRDVTATVESIPLITASILSKKCAEGAESFVFDVKCGNGAFMKTPEEAEALALSLSRTGEAMGRRIKCVITRMDQPLGHYVGNFLEVVESVRCLRGGGPEDLTLLSCRLTAWMLVLGGVESSLESAEARCRENLSNGRAWEKFLENVKAQGGDTSVLLEPEKGPAAPFTKEIKASRGGFVSAIRSFDVGIAASLLGAGRARKEDPVSPGAGIVLHKKVGDPVNPGDTLCVLHTDEEKLLIPGEKALEQAFSFSDEKTETLPLIIKEI